MNIIVFHIILARTHETLRRVTWLSDLLSRAISESASLSRHVNELSGLANSKLRCNWEGAGVMGLGFSTPSLRTHVVTDLTHIQ